jgi:hypothetical protein
MLLSLPRSPRKQSSLVSTVFGKLCWRARCETLNSVLGALALFQAIKVPRFVGRQRGVVPGLVRQTEPPSVQSLGAGARRLKFDLAKYSSALSVRYGSASLQPVPASCTCASKAD